MLKVTQDPAPTALLPWTSAKSQGFRAAFYYRATAVRTLCKRNGPIPRALHIRTGIFADPMAHFQSTEVPLQSSFCSRLSAAQVEGKLLFKRINQLVVEARRSSEVGLPSRDPMEPEKMPTQSLPLCCPKTFLPREGHSRTIRTEAFMSGHVIYCRQPSTSTGTGLGNVLSQKTRSLRDQATESQSTSQGLKLEELKIDASGTEK